MKTFPGVNFLVNLQRSPLGEPPPTALTKKRFLSRVDANMFHQVFLLRKRLRAYEATVRLEPRVGPYVVLQLFLAGQPLPASFADDGQIRLLVLRQSVFLQTKGCGVALTALCAVVAQGRTCYGLVMCVMAMRMEFVGGEEMLPTDLA